MLRDPPPQHHFRQRLDDLLAPQSPLHSDRQAFSREFIDQRQQSNRPAAMRHPTDQVVAPNRIHPLRPQPHAGTIIQPQSPSGPLFLRHFQSLSPPNPFHSILSDRPSSHPQQPGDSPISVPPLLRSQGDDCFG